MSKFPRASYISYSRHGSNEYPLLYHFMVYNIRDKQIYTKIISKDSKWSHSFHSGFSISHADFSTTYTYMYKAFSLPLWLTRSVIYMYFSSLLQEVKSSLFLKEEAAHKLAKRSVRQVT